MVISDAVDAHQISRRSGTSSPGYHTIGMAVSIRDAAHTWVGGLTDTFSFTSHLSMPLRQLTV